MDMETDKEQTKEEKEHWNHVPDELGKLLEEFIDKQENKITGKTKCNTDKGTDKERHSGAEAKDDTKTRAGTETKIAHKEESRSKKRPRDENEPGDKDKNEGGAEAESTIRRDEKRQDNKETTEDSKGRERTSWGKIGLVEFNEKRRNGNAELTTAKKKWTQQERSHDIGKNATMNSTTDQIYRK